MLDPDRCENVLRAWMQIRPKPAEEPSYRTAVLANEWLLRSVCPLTAELIVHPEFRALARWPLNHLVPGAKSDVRRQLVSVEVGILEWARILSNFVRTPMFGFAQSFHGDAKEPDRSISQAPVLICSGEESIGDQSDTALSEKGRENIVRMHIRRSFARASRHEDRPERIAEIAQHLCAKPWIDLASERDYFGPAAEMNLKSEFVPRNERGEALTEGGFLPCVNPKWGIPGDFVWRCALERTNHWVRELRALTRDVERLLKTCSPIIQERINAIREAEGAVATRLNRLKDMCDHAPKARLRWAAMTLVQIHAAFRPREEFGWLGGANGMSSWAHHYQADVGSWRNVEVGEYAADALVDLKPIFEGADVRSVISQMASERQLCLLQGNGRRECWWQGDPLDVDWNKHKRAWTLLFHLARKAKSSQGISERDPTEVSIWDARKDLKRLLPRALSVKIGASDRVHRLCLSPDAIYLAEIKSEERLEEITGRVPFRAPL